MNVSKKFRNHGPDDDADDDDSADDDDEGNSYPETFQFLLDVQMVPLSLLCSLTGGLRWKEETRMNGWKGEGMDGRMDE